MDGLDGEDLVEGLDGGDGRRRAVVALELGDVHLDTVAGRVGPGRRELNDVAVGAKLDDAVGTVVASAEALGVAVADEDLVAGGEVGIAIYR